VGWADECAVQRGVNAYNYETAVFFEYGTDGNTFPYPAAAVPAMVTGSSTQRERLGGGADEGTTYYYRMVAANAGGTVVSGRAAW